MPVLPYRALTPTEDAEAEFLGWIDSLDQQFAAADDVETRSEIVRDALAEIYFGASFERSLASASGTAAKAAVHSLDPRNATLEPEYYGDIDNARFAPRKPLIWFWMMYDRSPLGLNHWLGYRVRYMIAKHVLKHLGYNVKIFHGVEISYGYNLTIEDNCVIHKYVLLDDRGEIIIHEGSSVSDYANIYSHEHDLNDPLNITMQRTEIGPRARITYHATVMSGVNIGEHGLLGSLGVATKDIAPYNISVGIPARPVKLKSLAPEEAQRAFVKRHNGWSRRPVASARPISSVGFVKRIAFSFAGLVAGNAIVLLYYLLISLRERAMEIRMHMGEPARLVPKAFEISGVYAIFSVAGWVLIGVPFVLVLPGRRAARLNWPLRLLIGLMLGPLALFSILALLAHDHLSFAAFAHTEWFFLLAALISTTAFIVYVLLLRNDIGRKLPPALLTTKAVPSP